MNPHTKALINGYLDGMLTHNEVDVLNAWIKAAPQNAAAFADMVRLHDHLHGVMHANGLLEAKPEVSERKPASAAMNQSGRFTRRVSLLGGLAAIVASAFIAFFWWGSTPQVSAASELDRLIDKATDNRDRTYVIRNLDAEPEQLDDRRPPIDGAMLHVRHPDQYVLIRQFPDGRPFVTGSDGEKSWSIPPTGAVRVSSDPLRFRGPVPGNQHSIPFVNLRSDLLQIRDAYIVSPLGSNASDKRGLLAVKKSIEYRGPNRVELWYDAATGVIQRMVFAGMPKARGGPDSVVVELQELRELGHDFFRHQSHHTADRRVIEED